MILEFKALLEADNKLWIGQNAKYDSTLMKWYGVDIKGPYFDTMIAHYLCEPDQRHKLDYLTEAYLDYKMVAIEELIGKGKTQLTMRNVKLEKVAEYAGEDADFTLQLKPILEKKLEEMEMTDLYQSIEVPLINVLRDMEFEGVRINPDFLADYSKELEKEILRVEQEVYREAGGPFNIASPKQVGEVLFERMKLPYKGKKSSTGQYVTDVDKLTSELVNVCHILSGTALFSFVRQFHAFKQYLSYLFGRGYVERTAGFTINFLLYPQYFFFQFFGIIGQEVGIDAHPFKFHVSQYIDQRHFYALIQVGHFHFFELFLQDGLELKGKIGVFPCVFRYFFQLHIAHGELGLSFANEFFNGYHFVIKVGFG